ncbi:MAG: hypothetical protein HOP11_15215 [Saprospiraceae bacterium]|nr:hypothetical protein [Saprospiraceae bacterium]
MLLLQKSILGRNLVHSIHNKINSNLTNVFEHTGLYAQALNGKPYKVSGEISFTLQGSPPAKNYDTKLIFVNTKKLLDDIKANNLDGKVSMLMDMGDYRFSFWHFLLLPYCILFSLWLAGSVLYQTRWLKLGISILILGIVLSVEFIFTLIYMRANAQLLEPFGASSILTKVTNGIYSVQAIEFVYIKSALIWLILNTSELGEIFLKKK